jgi:gamma-glutamyltranspeptidase
MVRRDAELVMSFGTPEGDQQPQALTQVFLNRFVFGMDIQEAIDAPRFRSRSFPDSFAPHEYEPGVVDLEKSLHQSVGADLEAMGYRTEVDRRLASRNGCRVRHREGSTGRRAHRRRGPETRELGRRPLACASQRSLLRSQISAPET